MKYPLLIQIALFFFCGTSYSQHLTQGLKKIEIPFQFENNFVIVNVQFNKNLPLKFVFDTGAEYTVLTKREIADVMGATYEREFRIIGADLKTELKVYLARGLDLKIGSIESPNQDFLVMGEDFFKFETLTGVDVHGILGANFFSRYVVRINYRKRIITLYDPQYFVPPKGFEEIPITVYKNKPYINTDSKLFAQDSTSNLKLLIDSGASLSLLIYTNTHSALKVPEKVVRGNIGRGLGGFIEGFTGRFREISIGSYKLNNLVASYQELYEYMDTSEINNRNGLIGNLLLSRFDIIIDYYRQKLYVKPNRSYEKKFKFDRSGMFFLASGANLNTYTVNYIVPDSPAYHAGILKGDRIKRINWLPVGYLSMNDLAQKLQGRVGKKIKLVIIRNGKRMKKSFILREII